MTVICGKSYNLLTFLKLYHKNPVEKNKRIAEKRG